MQLSVVGLERERGGEREREGDIWAQFGTHPRLEPVDSCFQYQGRSKVSRAGGKERKERKRKKERERLRRNITGEEHHSDEGLARSHAEGSARAPSSPAEEEAEEEEEEEAEAEAGEEGERENTIALLE